MIPKKSTRKQFNAMFCQAMKATSIMAILALICFLFFTYVGYDFYDKQYLHGTGQFLDELRDAGIAFYANVCFVGAGLLNAMLTFNFVWSKKQANVVLSLGMKKSDIYFAKILGGIVPMSAAVLLAGIAETIANITVGYTLNNRFFAMAALTMLQFLVVYILSYVLSSAVIANTGNVVEGLIFTLLIALFPMTLNGFLSHAFWDFTHGAYILPTDTGAVEYWDWAEPFYVFSNFRDGFMDSYFNLYNSVLPSIYDWSGIIMAGVYSVAAVLLGYVGFKKRRNEICGTWGRARGMNEIAGAVTGFYAAYIIGLIVAGKPHGNGNFLNFLLCCIAFLAAYIIFKLIFGYKRKKEVKAAFNRFPVYAMGFAAVFIVFHFGLFGYSSKLPEASEVVNVKISTPYYKFMDEHFTSSSSFGLKTTTNIDYYYYNLSPDLDGSAYTEESYFPTVTFTTNEDIEKILKIHESFINDGKIKDDGAHSCSSDVKITYTLANGKTITRYYTEASEGTTLKLIALNDSKALNKTIFKFFNSYIDFDALMEERTDSEEYYYYQEYSYDAESGTDITYHHSRASQLASSPCYLFPKDMSAGYKLGYIDGELYGAIITDIKNMSANEYFNHSPADEIGVLSFGLSSSNFMSELWRYSGSGTVYADKVDHDKMIDEFPDGATLSTSWNVGSSDIKAVVLTKSMKNTIAYLEEHGLMKYFEPKLNVENVKSVKVATTGELYDGYYERTELYPIFYGAYWTSEQMEEWAGKDSVYSFDNYFFNNIHNEITDKAQIKKLVESSVIFGYCASESKIMEITYEDGAVATVMVSDSQ